MPRLLGVLFVSMLAACGGATEGAESTCDEATPCPSGATQPTTPNPTGTTSTTAGELESDGDGYSDADELYEGTDPNDYDDRIYTGFWPYWRDKDSLGEPGFPATLTVGMPFPRFRSVDQFGDEVDLYDFGGPDQAHDFLLVDMSANWAGPSDGLYDWLADQGDPFALEDDFALVRSRVDDGGLAWVNVLAQDASGSPTYAADVAAWADDHPHPHIPVVADSDRDVHQLFGGGVPTAVLIRAVDMEVVAFGYTIPDVLEEARARL